MVLFAKIENVINKIVKVLSGVSGVAVGLMAVLVAYSSIQRYFIKQAVYFMEDGAAILLSINFFLGFAFVFILGGHIKITLLTNNVPRKVADVLDVLASLIALGYLIIFTKEAYAFTALGIHLGSHSLTADIYLPPFFAIMCLGMTMFTIVMFLHFIKCVLKLFMKEEIVRPPEEKVVMVE